MTAVEHLDDATWERLAMRELSGEARAAALAHVSGCASCLKIYRGLALLEKEAREFDAAVPGPTPGASPPAGSAVVRWLFPAGAVLAAAAAVLLWVRSGSTPLDPTGTGTMRAGGALPEVALRAGAGCSADFAPFAGAEAYQVTWTREDGRAVAPAVSVSSGPVPAPPAAASSGVMFLKVEARAAGVPIAESKLVRCSASP